MGENSKIAWTDHTFNPWVGCEKVSAGCAHCYAEALMDTQYGKVEWGPNGTRIRTAAANWKKPLKWNREAAALGVRRKVFCASLADVFEARPELDAWRDDLFEMIEATPHLDWLLLTKRPAYAREWLDRYYETLSHDSVGGEVYGLREPLPNVWLGTSIENQETADARIPRLMGCHAALRFLSCEPLLAPIWFHWEPHPGMATMAEIERWEKSRVDWVIVGGESGRGFRACEPEWILRIVEQCEAAGVPVFVKQDSGPKPGQQGRISDELFIQEFPAAVAT
jgi:protein gp37